MDANTSFSTQYLFYLLGFLIIMYAQSRVTQVYRRYTEVLNSKNITGETVARRILKQNNLSDIKVEISNGGSLSDHYDPIHNVIKLSSEVYHIASIASMAIAAHEVGHALQYQHHYGFIGLRNRILPITIIASKLGWIVLVIGFFMLISTPFILYVGLAMIGVILLFQILTLPIEFNASTRALKQLLSIHLIDEDELNSIRRMLRAASFTYVASVLSTLTQIFRILLTIFSNKGNHQDS